MRSVFFILACVQPVLGQFVHYNGSEFPEEAGQGWSRIIQAHYADRAIEAGWFVQTPVPLPCPPECTTQDFYNRSIEDQAGAEFWVMDWVVESTTPLNSSDVVPASIVASGNLGIRYHFTIGVDEVRFLRNTSVFVEISPGPHQYRLELDNSEPPGTYRFMIDGEIVDEGTAEGVFPTADSFIVFGAATDFEPNTTRWDYIEFGTPNPPIPATSNWGLGVMALLTATAGTLFFRRYATHG